MICLDNDVFRKYTTDPPDENVVEYLVEHRREPWSIPSTVLFEWLQVYDSHATIRSKRRDADEIVDEFLAFDDDAAVEAANMRAGLSTAGTSLDALDLLNAATARDAGATFVTGNRSDFDKAPIRQLMDVDIVETG